jgi:antitoxin FitA
MAALTIRKISDDLKGRLRQRAAANNRSMEEEARAILRSQLGEEEKPIGIGTLMRRRFEALGGYEIEIPPREPARDPPDFSKE